MAPQQERGGLCCRGRRVAVFLSEAPRRGGTVIQAESQGCGTQVTCRKGPISLVGLLGKFSVRPGLSGCLPTVPGAGPSAHSWGTPVLTPRSEVTGARGCFFSEQRNGGCITITTSTSVCHSVVSGSVWPQALRPARLLCPWDSPGENTGRGCHAFLQGDLPDSGTTVVNN